jgi:hypothetical protein
MVVGSAIADRSASSVSTARLAVISQFQTS